MADGPPNPNLSVSDLIALGKSVWQAFVVPLGLAVWGAYRFMVGRRDTNTKSASEQVATERQHLSGEINAFMDRQSRRIGELEQGEHRADAENGILTERWVEARHAASNARQMVNALEKLHGMPLTVWPAWSWNKPEG